MVRITKSILLLLLITFCWGALLKVPPSPAAAIELPPLESLPPCNFNAYTDRSDIMIGAVVLNLETGTGCMQNLNTVFPVASVGKLFVAGALYEKVVRGEISFETELEFTEEYFMNGRDDCLNEVRLGQKITIGELGDLMIWCSDNAATWMLMDFIGWDSVQQYIEQLGIADIGTVVPYSEVDQVKLTLIDVRWEDVPTAIASQYYRSRFTEREMLADLLVPEYFATFPEYSREALRQANADYLSRYEFNTVSPRALAEFMLKLWRDAQQPESEAGQVAQWIFNTMLLTQRGYTTQEFPGQVYVGSKNGYDLGMRAEANITVNALEGTSRIPETISIVFARFRDVTSEGVPFRFRGTPIEDVLRAVSPAIVRHLYPDFVQEPPIYLSSVYLRLVTFNQASQMNRCWNNYLSFDTANGLSRCWGAVPKLASYALEDWLGCGIVLRDLEGQDARITFILTLPDGSHWSYQQQRFFQDSAGFYLNEQLTQSGLWKLDVYLNLVPIVSEQFYVG